MTDCNQHTIIGDNSSTQGDVDIYYRNPSKNKFDFSEMLVVTNPILLWLFKHGWEDPGWGRDDASQILILLRARTGRSDLGHRTARAGQETVVQRDCKSR